MKKTALIVLLTAAMVFACAAAAFAAYGNSTYNTWADAQTAPGVGSSPHASYSTSTRNCSVCHAVHNAGTGGTPGEALLRETIGDACNYCHVGGAGGYTQVYNGDPQAYLLPDIAAHDNDNASGLGVRCVDCHATHGASTVATGTFILKMGTTTYSGSFQETPTSGLPGQYSPWCSGCHAYYNPVAEGGHNQTTHVMRDDLAVNFQTHNAAASYTGQVAWSGSATCMSCHNSDRHAAGSGISTGFPHYTPNEPRFMKDGIANTAGTLVNNDGPCLRCHESGGSGIGIDF